METSKAMENELITIMSGYETVLALASYNTALVMYRPTSYRGLLMMHCAWKVTVRTCCCINVA